MGLKPVNAGFWGVKSVVSGYEGTDDCISEVLKNTIKFIVYFISFKTIQCSNV